MKKHPSYTSPTSRGLNVLYENGQFFVSFKKVLIFGKSVLLMCGLLVICIWCVITLLNFSHSIGCWLRTHLKNEYCITSTTLQCLLNEIGFFSQNNQDLPAINDYMKECYIWPFAVMTFLPGLPVWRFAMKWHLFLATD